ncbi:MAG: hypothetical protein ACK4SY_01270 [Pyrobaculum sp.]
MEFRLVVTQISDDSPNVITFRGDVEIVLELPLDRLGLLLKEGERVKLVLSQEREENYKNYKAYMWGIVYHVGDGVTRISIGGLQLDIKKELPFRTGEKVYIGLL